MFTASLFVYQCLHKALCVFYGFIGVLILRSLNVFCYIYPRKFLTLKRRCYNGKAFY